jgi:hypothetical protein
MYRELTFTCVAISFCADVAALINAPAAFMIDLAASRICSSKFKFSLISYREQKKI